MKITVASKTEHAPMWLRMQNQGIPIISSWIREAGEGQSASYEDLAIRCIDEVTSSNMLVLFCIEGDLLKGALIEAGAALAAGIPVYCIGECASLSRVFSKHPLWIPTQDMESALLHYNDSRLLHMGAFAENDDVLPRKSINDILKEGFLDTRKTMSGDNVMLLLNSMTESMQHSRACKNMSGHVASSINTSVRDYMFFLMMAGLGLKCEEVASLSVPEAMDACKSANIKVVYPKDLHRLLEGYVFNTRPSIMKRRGIIQNNQMFPNQKGQLSKNSMQHRYSKALRNIRDLVFHTTFSDIDSLVIPNPNKGQGKKNEKHHL